MGIRSRVPKGKGSETRAKARTREVAGKRQAPYWGEDIVRSAWKRAAVQEVFDSGYDMDANGCWRWKLGKSHGYGEMRVHEVCGETPLYAHRVSFLLHVGPTPRGLRVCHSCDNGYCVNPKHLFGGTQRDNLRDMVHKNRHPKGEDNGQAKVTDLQVAQIRQLAATGVRQYVVAKRYGLSDAQVSRIVRGRQRSTAAGGKTRWQHGNFKHGLYVTNRDEHQ